MRASRPENGALALLWVSVSDGVPPRCENHDGWAHHVANDFADTVVREIVHCGLNHPNGSLGTAKYS